jgi:methionine-rich copper-binding protein CopC
MLPVRSATIPLRLALVAVLLAPVAGDAHALLVESTPADGATIPAAPPRVVLRFDSRIERQLTRAVLSRPDGTSLPLAAVPDDAGPDRIAFALPPLPPGDYRLTYRVLSVDGHSTPGLIRFTIRPGAAAP